MTNLQLEELNDALAHKVFVLPSSRGKKDFERLILKDFINVLKNTKEFSSSQIFNMKESPVTNYK